MAKKIKKRLNKIKSKERFPRMMQNEKKFESVKEEKKEGKETKKIEVILILGLVAILAFIGIFLILSGEEQKPKIPASNASIVINEESKTTQDMCLSSKGITEDVIYIYQENCVYSQRNTPWVLELKNQSSIRMIDYKNTEEFIGFMNCFNFNFEGTPTYICLKNSKIHPGSFDSKSELIAFINDCK